MSLMEQFTNPETMHALSFGDKMLASTITMCMGIGVTFLILCILWAFIVVMGKVMNFADRPKAAKEAPVAPAPAAAPAATAASDADEIAVVIAAAIAAYEAEAGGTGIIETVTNLNVKRIVRVPSGTTLWADAARNEHIDSRRV